jgi:uncharacterized membrane protein
MIVALVGLAGLFMSVYLLLHALGVYGALACGGSGSCDYVQASAYARFLGLPVPGWGVAWYGVVFAIAMLSLQPRFADAQWPGRALLLLATCGLAFSVYLTAIEAFVLRAYCLWCVTSAILTVLIFLCALPWRGSLSGGRSPEALEGGPVP